MSRVGTSKLKLPESVNLKVENNTVQVTSKKSANVSATYVVPEEFNIVQEEGCISLSPKNMDNVNVALWGTNVRNLFQTIKGVDTPFERKVTLVGVGYKAAVQGRKLVLDLGYSHKIEYDLPELVEVKAEKPTELVFSSISKQKLGQAVSEVMQYRPPEPYKGKGIIPEGVTVMRKEGKKK